MTCAMQPDLAALLPHAPPMLMVSELLRHDGERIECRATISADNPLLVDGRVPPYGGLEILAQAAGVLLGLRHRERGDRRTPRGAIVQVKSFSLSEIDLPTGSRVHAWATLLGDSPDAAVFEGETSVDGQVFFRGSLMLMTRDGDQP